MSAERSLDPPEPKTPPSGHHIIYVEREIGDECVELEVGVWFDEGSIWRATVDGKVFKLTPDEIQRAEEDWAMREPDERDDGERDLDR